MQTRRQRLALAGLGLVLAMAGLVVGSGAANATFSPCNDGMGSNDHHVSVDNNTFVGVEAGVYDIGDQQHQYYCLAATGGEANQSWVKWEVWPTSDTGRTANAYSCFTVVLSGCPTLLGSTGANVNPVTSTNLPASGAAGTGASAGAGPGTCAYADGSATCPGASAAVGATVAENDISLVPGKTAVDPNASTQPLVTVTVAGTTTSTDTPTSSHCIGVC